MGRGETVSEVRKGMNEMETAMNHCCSWCAFGMLLVTSESDDAYHHLARHGLEWPLQDWKKRVSLHNSDHKIFLLYILNEVRHEIVLKLVFHYTDIQQTRVFEWSVNIAFLHMYDLIVQGGLTAIAESI
jgi:hypothetical protein